MTCNAHALAASRRMLVAEDVDLIQETIRGLPKRNNLNVLDIGAGSGTTALSAFEAGPPVTVYSMDSSEDGLHWARVAIGNVGMLDGWRAAIGWDELWGIFGLKKIHFAMIDHEHTYEAVTDALAQILPRMAKTGRVWLHDYGDPRDVGLPSEPTPGVKQAVDEAANGGGYRYAGEASGLGIVLAPLP